MGSTSNGRELESEQSALSRKYPATSAQQAFWALSASAPGRSVGVEILVMELRGTLDVAVLRLAIDLLERRYDAWRTCFEDMDGTLMATVGEPAGGMLSELERPVPDEALRPAALRCEVQAMLAAPMDLGRAPLVRTTLVRLAEDHHALLVAMHHSVADGVSLFVALPRALDAVYSALVDRREAPAAHALELFEVAVRERVHRESPRGTALRAFWSSELRDAPEVLELPADHRRPSVRSLRGARIERALDGEARARLEEAARALGVRPLDVCLAAFSLVCARLTSAREVLVGTAHANRRDAAEAETFGCLVVNVPVRCEVLAAASFGALAQSIHARRRAAFAHVSPLVDEAIAELATDTSRHAGYQVALNYMPFSERAIRLADLAVRAWRPDPG